jgi:phosphohistidine phosphatase
MRHAKSTWKETDLADHDRPLNKRGRRDAPAVGALLRREDLLPDLILCSTATRARETAKALVETSGYGGEIKYKRSLYAAPPDAVLRALRGLADKHGRVMVIGHNPGLEELLEMLTGEEERLTTAAVAHVALHIEGWAALRDHGDGELLALWRPRDLDQPPSS